MNILLYLIAPIVYTVLLGASAPRDNDADGYDNRAQRLKAEYIYLQAESEIETGKDVSYAYALMSHAHRVDPANLDIAGRLSEINLRLGMGDSVQQERYYATLLNKYLDNPSDVHSAFTFLGAAEARGDKMNIVRVLKALSEHKPYRNDIALQYAVSLADAADADHIAYYDSALAVCDRVAHRIDDEANIDVLSRRLYIYESMNDTASFIGELQRFRKISPDNPEINVAIASVYEAIQQTDSAMACYNHACALDSTYGPAFLGRANLYMHRGDTAGYNREVLNVLKSNGLEFGAKMEMLKGYTKYFITDTIEGRKDIANMYDVMQNVHPGEAELHFYHGLFQLVDKKNAEAAEHLSYAIDLNPEERNYHSAYMDAALLSGDTIGAINAGRRAYQRFDDASFALTSAAYMSQVKQTDAAIALLDSIDLDKVDNYELKSLIFQTRGDLYYQLDDVDKALAEYDIAINIDPYNSGAMNNAAYFMAVENRNLDRALTLIEKVMTLDGKNPTNIDTYAWVLFKRKDYAGARKQIDRALQYYADPTDSVSHALGDKIDSEEFGEIFIEQASVDVLDHAGDIYFMTGEPELALRFWELALALEPNNERIKKKVTLKTYFFE